ncbi:hypothetical protein, partial [Leptospira noguchii]|uniref:hypothetical protein n=1 Tax=Leptospira noguchii TaxID=28182 RepID=UPI001F2F7FCF
AQNISVRSILYPFLAKNLVQYGSGASEYKIFLFFPPYVELTLILIIDVIYNRVFEKFYSGD